MQHLEDSTQSIGHSIYRLMQGETPGVFNRDFWQGKLMTYVMQDPSFKVDLFRFVDVLPTLQSTEEIARHIKEYLLKENRPLPTMLSLALKSAVSGLGASLGTKALRKNIIDMAERFIIGQNATEATKVLRGLHAEGFAFTVDLLGEATLNTDEANAYRDRYLDLIDTLALETQRWPQQSQLNHNHRGTLPLNNVSIKLSAMEPMLNALDHAGSVKRLKERLLPIFRRARDKQVFLNLDLEQWELHNISYDLFESIVMEEDLRSYPHFAIVVQGYLRTSGADVERLINIAKKRGSPLGVRLVKGAYWDYEIVHARQMGRECPVFDNKAATDASYEKLSRSLLDNIEYVLPAFGSHNVRSLAQALAYAESRKIPKNAYEIQMLYGMAEPERKALREMGHRVRLYAPVGELLPGMAYLVRRLLENTSNSGFLRLSHEEHVDKNLLLQTPEPLAPQIPEKSSSFHNASLADFTRSSVRADFTRAILAADAEMPMRIPVVVDGKASFEGESFTRTSPNQNTQVVAHVTMASTKQAQEAVALAHQAYPAWRDTALSKRAQLLDTLANLLEGDRVQLAALQCIEVAKPMAEADADVAEAIDFCRYYARQALLELAPQEQGNMWGEHNLLCYEGRGVAVVIAPWNFPLAILCGMSVAALVAGNTVVMKPAEQSSAIAYALYTRMMQAGFPKDVVHFLPGKGEEIGPVLVNHPLVAQIAFTGSKAVGHSIVENAAKVQEGQLQMKRVVCEMGGKNAIIIDSDADIDEAVSAVLKSAFAFAGQKCSAASRVLVVGDAYEAFVTRFSKACEDICSAAATDPACLLPPVVDEESSSRLKEVIDAAQKRVRTLFIGPSKTGGNFVPAAVFAVENADDPLMQQEFFGPIVALMHIKSFDDALKIANTSEFALTGAVFSRSPVHLEKARTSFRVGNLYLNRGSTGAMVDRQPFGGFKMSGIGTKAGGPGYLLHFVEPRCITENTMRRGFTPEVTS